MLNNNLLHDGTNDNHMMVMRKRMRMSTLIKMPVIRIVFDAIVKVWEVIRIVVIVDAH